MLLVFFGVTPPIQEGDHYIIDPRFMIECLIFRSVCPGTVPLILIDGTFLPPVSNSFSVVEVAPDESLLYYKMKAKLSDTRPVNDKASSTQRGDDAAYNEAGPSNVAPIWQKRPLWEDSGMVEKQWIEELHVATMTVSTGSYSNGAALMLYGIKWDLYRAFDFQRDVAEHCDHIFINDEEYDFNYPGRSGHNFIAETNDEQTLRKEIRSRLAELLWTDRWKVLQYRRRQEAEEQERKNRRPTNSLLLCKIYKLSVDLTLTLTPTPVEYHIELLGKPSLRYRLWVRDRQ